jgi:hypothetical protein
MLLVRRIIYRGRASSCWRKRRNLNDRSRTGEIVDRRHRRAQQHDGQVGIREREPNLVGQAKTHIKRDCLGIVPTQNVGYPVRRTIESRRCNVNARACRRSMQHKAGKWTHMVRRPRPLICGHHITGLRVAGGDDGKTLRGERWTQALGKGECHVFLDGTVCQLRTSIWAAVRRVDHDQIAVKARQRLWQCRLWRLGLSCGLRRCRLSWRLRDAVRGAQKHCGRGLQDGEAGFCHGSWGVRFDCSEECPDLQRLTAEVTALRGECGGSSTTDDVLRSEGWEVLCPSKRSMAGLVESVDREAAQQFGVEVGRLLRHHIARERDVLQLLQGNRLDQKGDIGLAVGDQRRRLVGLA